MDTSPIPSDFVTLIVVHEFMQSNGLTRTAIRQHRPLDPEDDGPPAYYIGIDTDEADAMSVDVIDGQIFLWDRRIPWSPNRLNSERSTTIGDLCDPTVFDKLIAEVRRRL